MNTDNTSSSSKKSVIADSIHVKAMIRALRIAGYPVESTRTTYVVKNHKGREVFRAMKGSPRVGSTWLVRHDAQMFAPNA